MKMGTLGKRARESSKPHSKRRAEGGCRGGEGRGSRGYTDKKENQIFLIYIRNSSHI
jgi:hypothetical protein